MTSGPAASSAASSFLRFDHESTVLKSTSWIVGILPVRLERGPELGDPGVLRVRRRHGRSDDEHPVQRVAQLLHDLGSQDERRDRHRSCVFGVIPSAARALIIGTGARREQADRIGVPLGDLSRDRREVGRVDRR